MKGKSSIGIKLLAGVLAGGLMVSTATAGGHKDKHGHDQPPPAAAGATDSNPADNIATDTDRVIVGSGTVSFRATSAGRLSGTALQFGNQSGPDNRATVTLAVEGSPVTFGEQYVTNTAGAGFAIVSDDCAGETIAAGGTCTVTLKFDARRGNSVRSGSLTVPDSGADSPQILDLSGN